MRIVMLCVLGVVLMAACVGQGRARGPTYGHPCSSEDRSDGKTVICGAYVCVDGRCEECDSDEQCGGSRCVDGACSK